MTQTILLFPGQGSQTIGMAKDFFDNFKESRLVFEEASDILQLNLKRLCFEGPLEELTLTENLQPALLTAEIAMYLGLRIHKDIKTTAFAGHSLGEYTAHVAAGSLTLAQAVSLTRLRGKAMQAACTPGEGSMAAVLNMPPADLEVYCQQTREQTGLHISPANFNAPGQIVIAGHADAVKAFEKTVSEVTKTREELRRVKLIPLQVSAPFHCALMEPARKTMSIPLAQATFQKPSAPIIQNVTAKPSDDHKEFARFLTDQIVSPVLWQQSMETLQELGIESAIEVGPGRVLSGLLKRILGSLPCQNVSSVESLKQLQS